MADQRYVSELVAATKASLVAGLVALSLVVVSGNPAVADSWKPSWPQGLDAQEYHGVVVQELFTGPESNSSVRGVTKATVEGMPNEYVCDDSRSGDCDPLSTHLQAFVVLPPCDAEITSSCIESVSAGTSSDLREAKFVTNTGGPTLQARPTENLPAAGTASLWKWSVAGSEVDLAAIAVVTYDWSRNGFLPTRLEAQLVPYSVKTGNFQPFTQEVRTLPNGRSAVNSKFDQNCVWQDTGRCGVREDFPNIDLRARLTLRLDSGIGGWFKGRLSTPDFEVSAISAQSNRVQVTGSPANVPQVAIGTLKDGASDKVKEQFSKQNQPGYTGGFVNVRADYPNTPAFLTAFRDVAKDKSQGSLSLWSFGTLPTAGNPCLSDTSKLLGLVTTNATAYDGQAPAFKESTLQYSVAGYHYLPDGSLNLGTYDLIMRKETARCLYGFSSAPISASVSVTSESGSENVAVTSFNEVGDWDHFAAYGFTFSSPKIEVKLSQAADPKPTPTATTPTVKKTTITCVKGKTVKKVTAVKPKCPAGYKKK